MNIHTGKPPHHSDGDGGRRATPPCGYATREEAEAARERGSARLERPPPLPPLRPMWRVIVDNLFSAEGLGWWPVAGVWGLMTWIARTSPPESPGGRIFIGVYMALFTAFLMSIVTEDEDVDI